MEIHKIIKELIEKAGFPDYSVEVDEENRKLTVFINEGEWFKIWVPLLINDFSHLIRVIAKKTDSQPFFIDINNYRKERENIITNLAKAAARKAVVSKEIVRLPAMNAYERRLIHAELSTRPDVKTESNGDEPKRCVFVKPLD